VDDGVELRPHRGLEHQLRSADVGLHHLVVAAPIEREDGGRVNERVAARDRTRYRLRVGDVPRDVVDPFDAQGVQGAADSAGIPHQQTHVVAPIREGGGGVTADEAGSPGHQNAHASPSAHARRRPNAPDPARKARPGSRDPRTSRSGRGA